MLMRSLIVALVCCLALVEARKGVLELDKDNFDKIVDGSKNVLVEFVEYSWKDSQSYDTVGEEFSARKDILVAKIATHDNPEFKTRFAIVNEPAVKWFPKGSTTPIDFMGDVSTTNKESAKDIIQFVNSNLSPQMQDLTSLAKRFVNNPTAELVQEATHLTSQLDAAYKDFGTTFLSVMTKIQERGASYPVKERTRLNTLIQNKSTKKDKQRDFSKRLNVVELFITPEADAADKAANPPPPPPPPTPPTPTPPGPSQQRGDPRAKAKAKAPPAKPAAKTATK